MKLVKISDEELRLAVLTTNKDTKILSFPTKNIHYWYPFNMNYFYVYSDSKKFPYLVKDRKYRGKNYYHTKRLKRTKAMQVVDGVPANLNVKKRNEYIINRAKSLGIVGIDEEYTMEDVTYGFKRLSEEIDRVRQVIEERYIEEEGSLIFTQLPPTEESDEELYKKATEQEKEFLIELGEIYVMLGLMRKLAS